MPQWMSQEEIVKDTAVFLKMQHALCGVYFWEFVVSLDFEWSFITGRKKLNWPMIPYFGGRYITLFTLIGLLVSLDVTTEVNCQALYTFLAFGGQAMIGFASANLAIRAMAIWSQSRYVVIPLSVLIAGHWAIIMQGVVVKASWDPVQGCVASATKTSVLTATFTYSICLDFIVFCLSAWKLAMPKHKKSQLVTWMFRDGLGYFALASLVNIPAAVFISLHLNPVMDIIFNVPAALMSTILASRAVRRLANFSSATPSVYITNPSQGLASRTDDQATTGANLSFAAGRARARGVHVQMNTFTVNEDASDFATKSKVDPESLEFDGTRGTAF
ncbi:hypothetical protein EUX98_g7113 [Antrodiella citrinella]|uniref:Uncharacterized protein n=1 Tax=Antrodiella citrinella TaxID=2447956 RepID=A0A4V3XHX0_9APHY|nr:hypothetical protein EUX98_g7113 [Antrodiella citrinella]